MVEPIQVLICTHTHTHTHTHMQGEAGVVVPDAGYMRKAKEICKKHNVLLIADEVQTGCGRTGIYLYINIHVHIYTHIFTCTCM